MPIYNCYYVYAYLRTDGTPYYIGKGKGTRAWSLHHSVNLPNNSKLVVFLETNLTEVGALALERRYIRWYGRKDCQTGILRNQTDGGEGTSGYKQSLQHIQSRKSSHLGVKRSPEARERMRTANLGKRRGSYNIVVSECPHCGKVGRHSNMVRHHFDKCQSQTRIVSYVP